jgi:hypothetical protein
VDCRIQQLVSRSSTQPASAKLPPHAHIRMTGWSTCGRRTNPGDLLFRNIFRPGLDRVRPRLHVRPVRCDDLPEAPPFSEGRPASLTILSSNHSAACRGQTGQAELRPRCFSETDQNIASSPRLKEKLSRFMTAWSCLCRILSTRTDYESPFWETKPLVRALLPRHPQVFGPVGCTI